MLIDWLRKEVTWRELPKFFLKMGLLVFVISVMNVLLLEAFGFKVKSEGVLPEEELLKLGVSEILIYALAEELIFRAPLYIPAYFGWNILTAVGAVASSFIFGWVHGDLLNLSLQGIGGIIFAITFLKCGALHKKFFKGLVACTSAHATVNLAVYGILSLPS